MKDKNEELSQLQLLSEYANDERIAIYNNSDNRDNRDEYPFLPLSNTIKNRLFEGVFISKGKINSISKSISKKSSSLKSNKTRKRSFSKI
jgi:hypothetical protein